MILDKELHRSVLLELIAKTNWPGTFGKELGPLIAALENATIAEPHVRPMLPLVSASHESAAVPRLTDADISAQVGPRGMNTP